MIQRNNTKKLYFSKWPYKVELRIGGASYLKRMSIPKVKSWCALSDFDRKSNWWGRNIDNIEMARFIDKFEPFLQYDHQLRAEYNTLNFYTADENIVNLLEKECGKWIASIWAPSSPEELDLLLNQRRKIICNQLPYSGFKYKVTLKETTANTIKNQFRVWAENYDHHTLKCSNSTIQWLSGDKIYCQTPFFYLKDEKLLTMCRLFLGNSIRSIEEYIPRYTLISE